MGLVNLVKDKMEILDNQAVKLTVPNTLSLTSQTT
jgi:hypothetical protein